MPSANLPPPSSAPEGLPGASTGPSPALVAALRQVLRPLVRLMQARGITYPYLADLLKGLFVEVADREFRLGDKPPTDSRVSLVSGVHRKDVARLRAAMHSDDARAPAVVSLGAQLVAHWLGNSQYLDDTGQPLPLPRFTSEGGALSFESLVASVNSDIRSRVVLDEWLRLGVVHLDEQRRVCLNAEAFVPAQGFDEKAFYLGHNLHDHAAAAVHNLLGELPAAPSTAKTAHPPAGFVPFMERSVHYNELPPEAMAQLAKLAQQRGMQALLAVNKSAMQAAQAASGADGANAADSGAGDAGGAAVTGVTQPKQRMTFGMYFYTEPAPGEGVASSKAQP